MDCYLEISRPTEIECRFTRMWWIVPFWAFTGDVEGSNELSVGQWLEHSSGVDLNIA